MPLFRKNKPLDPALILAAIPVRNPKIRERDLGGGTLRLTGPLRRGRLSTYLGIGATEKSFDLDPLGADVWHACDGTTNVESLIRHFAEAHRLNIREAEVAVQTFLNTLIQRNLIALVGPIGESKNSESKK